MAKLASKAESTPPTYLEVLGAPWEPPPTLSPATLEQLPLMPGVDILAFGASVAPAEMPDLMRRAHRQRAAKALFKAAREGKIVQFGTPRAGGNRQLIPATEFDVALVLGEEDNGIYLDLDAVSMDRFIEARENPERRPLWRDVHIDRQSLAAWLTGDGAAKQVPKDRYAWQSLAALLTGHGPAKGVPKDRLTGDGPAKRVPKARYAWPPFNAEVWRLLDEHGDINPALEPRWNKAALTNRMLAWCKKRWGKEPATSTVKSRVNEALKEFRSRAQGR